MGDAKKTLAPKNPPMGGVITFDKPTSETSVAELTDMVVNEYRSARLAVRGR